MDKLEAGANVADIGLSFTQASANDHLDGLGAQAGEARKQGNSRH
ncbi:hypothetical protein [Pseudomonas sp. BN102]|nr:hypothetical protein [Pseudomonas sp. BN102]